MLLFIGGLGLAEIIIISIFVFLPLILTLWALIDILRSTFKDNTSKLVWVIVVIFVPILGALLYLAMGRSQKASNSFRP